MLPDLFHYRHTDFPEKHNNLSVYCYHIRWSLADLCTIIESNFNGIAHIGKFNM